MPFDLEDRLDLSEELQSARDIREQDLVPAMWRASARTDVDDRSTRNPTSACLDPRSKSMEYRPRTTVADAALRKQVAAAGVRALMRATNLSQHTLEAIRTGKRVRSAAIQRVIVALGKTPT